MLALAPLDAWARIVARSGGVKPRYWLRFALVLFTSGVGTLLTLPERVLVRIGSTRSGAGEGRLDHPPGVLVVAGYYRSGTTHVHNLLACDPGCVTPRWAQAMAPQGFVFSWWITRLLLIPFVGGSRPQDAVGFGPMWPGEDDFALAGWGACSTLPGRLIFPGAYGRWSEWNTLDACSARQRERWKRTLACFAWKVTRAHPGRVLVLKTPSHGAHLGALREVFGDRLRVIHVTRDPARVIDSNMRMHHALRRHTLGDRIDADTLRARIVREYLRIERATREGRESGGIPSVTLTHEDVCADPVGALGRALTALGTPMSRAHADAADAYGAALGTHAAEHDDAAPLGTPRRDEPERIEEIRSIHAELAPSASTPEPRPARPRAPRSAHPRRGVMAALGAALAFALAWIALVWAIKQAVPLWRPRLDQLVWLGGALIGIGGARAAGLGSRTLGIASAALTLLVFVGVSFPITVINWNWAADARFEHWAHHNIKGAIHGLTAPSSVVFAALGALTAYRHARDDGPRAPGV